MEIQSTHLQAKLIKRSQGQSAVASAAYRSGQKLVDKRAGKTFDYTRRHAVNNIVILAPDEAPEWASDRTRLWNEVETIEKRKDAQLAREIELSLPASLSEHTRNSLVWDFCFNNFVAHGMVADIAIHGPGAGDPRNHHAHVMLTTRSIGPDGFGKKDRSWNANERLEGWKIAWEAACNSALENARANIRVDRRSIADRHQAALDAVEAATDWAEKQQLQIEAERLDYIPRPHLPARIYRAMEQRQPIPPLWQEPIHQWKEAQKSYAEAQLRADRLEVAFQDEITANAAEEARREALATQEAAKTRQIAQEAAKHTREAKARKTEALILQSRNRVLRARTTLNVAKGTWQNLKAGRKAFQPFQTSDVKVATDKLLTAAKWLLKVWKDFRAGRHSGDFKKSERDYVDASEKLTEMHLVLEKPKDLNGAELVAEKERLTLLQEFEDQELIKPALSVAKNRLTKIIRYMKSPEGAEYVDHYNAWKAEQDHSEALKAEEFRQRQKEDKIARDKSDRAIIARGRKERIAIFHQFADRAQTDQQIREIIERYAINLNRPTDRVAQDERWLEFTQNETRVTWYAIKQQIEELDFQRSQEQEHISTSASAPFPKSEPKTEKHQPQKTPSPKPRGSANGFSP